MKVYIPNTAGEQVGGGWSFLRNLKKGLANSVHFVDKWQDCDVFLIMSVTTTETGEVHEAKRAGKKIVFRVDNVPRKSRNRRQTPHERMQEFGKLADLVIYQSEWAKEYCSPLAGPGMVIYNGVDTSIFKPADNKPEQERYLFAYHGKSELKCFWQAHYHFQMVHRQNPKAMFWFIYDFGRELEELERSNFDFWNGEHYVHLQKATTAEDMAKIMQQCSYLIFPSFADASPNTVLEARACGLNVIGTSEIGGTKELLDIDYSLDRMAEEYLSAFYFITGIERGMCLGADA